MPDENEKSGKTEMTGKNKQLKETLVPDEHD